MQMERSTAKDSGTQSRRRSIVRIERDGDHQTKTCTDAAVARRRTHARTNTRARGLLAVLMLIGIPQQIASAPPSTPARAHAARRGAGTGAPSVSGLTRDGGGGGGGRARFRAPHTLGRDQLLGSEIACAWPCARTRACACACV